MNVYEKLHAIQCAVDSVIKDGKNLSDKYDFASDENVLDTFRPLLDEHKLLLIPAMTDACVHEGTTRSGTTRFMTEIRFNMIFHDVESGEEVITPWYGQGVDLAGEKGVGKAATYAEKYFLLKFFHVGTKKDDPDADPRTQSGEKRLTGKAKKELEDMQRKSISAMLNELYSGDAEKISAGLKAVTKNDKRGYAGAACVSEISDAALPVVYGKIKTTYAKRMGKEFTLEEGEGNANS